jgi:hypothetical protein
MMDLEALAERRRVEDEQNYGKPSERRRARVQMTPQLTYGLLSAFALPRMTRVVGIKPMPNESDMLFFELIVESPDVPEPAEDGTLPLVDMTASLHSMSKDRATAQLSMVEYVAVAAWKDKPETRAATPMFGKIMSSHSPTQAKLLKAALDEGPFEEHSPAYALLRDAKWIAPEGAPEKFSTWEEFVAGKDEAFVRKALVTMLTSFWGKGGAA